MQHYTEDFYTSIDQAAQKAADQIVPHIMDLISPNRVVDIGCGLGAWLTTFQLNGATEILGVDNNYVDVEKLRIPRDKFLSHNLSDPLIIDEVFDLAICLEVAEHIPSEKAESLVNTLCQLAPAILFSAAIPYQPGTHHVNCQWPDYWLKIFRKAEYVCFDCLRMKFWHNSSVPWWYSQNMLLLVKESYLDHYPLLSQNFSYKTTPPSLVHPELHLLMQSLHQNFYDTWLPDNISLKQATTILLKSTVRQLNFLKKFSKSGT